MPVSCRFVALCLTLVVLPAFAGRCGAQTYRDDKRHFSIELPQGWVAMSQSELDQVNARLGGGLLGGKVHYDGGLRKKTGRLGSLPYALIQSVSAPPGGASYEDIEKSLAVDLKKPVKEVQGRLGDLVKDLKIGQPVLNRESKCVVLRTEMNAPGIGDIKGFSIGHLGRDNLVFVHCYTKGSDFDAAMPVFRRLNDWFSFDKGYDFKPGAGGVKGFSWGSIGRSSIVGGVIGLLVGVGGFCFRFLTQSNAAKNSSATDVNSLGDPI